MKGEEEKKKQKVPSGWQINWKESLIKVHSKSTFFYFFYRNVDRKWNDKKTFTGQHWFIQLTRKKILFTEELCNGFDSLNSHESFQILSYVKFRFL